jgi:hypothetical protein
MVRAYFGTSRSGPFDFLRLLFDRLISFHLPFQLSHIFDTTHHYDDVFADARSAPASLVSFINGQNDWHHISRGFRHKNTGFRGTLVFLQCFLCMEIFHRTCFFFSMGYTSLHSSASEGVFHGIETVGGARRKWHFEDMLSPVDGGGAANTHGIVRSGWYLGHR